MTAPTLLVGAFSALSCMVYMDMGGISFKDAVTLPSFAKKELVHAKNRSLIRQMESIIESSRDLDHADQRIRDTHWPDKVLHISLASGDRLSGLSAASYSKTAWTNLRSVIRDGSGYGTVLTADGSQELLIVDSSRNCKSGANIRYTIYVERHSR